MKVKNRLAFQFSMLFALLLIIAFTGIYLFIQQYRTRAFFKQLDDRAQTVAQFYLAEDNLSATKFRDVLKKFPQSLSQESFHIYNERLEPTFVREDSVKWPKAFLKQVLQGKLLHVIDGGKQTTGVYYADNSGNFLVIVSATDQNGLKSMSELKLIMMLFFFSLLVITFFLGRVFARISLSPIIRIRNNLATIKATDLHKRLSVDTDRVDEIDSLSLSINQLLEHLEHSFESQRSFVAHSSHELRTPLTSILGQAETTLLKERSASEYQSALQGVIESVIELKQIINSLLELAEINMDIKDFEEIRADELAWEIADEFSLNFGEDKLDVSYQLAGYTTATNLYGNRRLLFIAISNILNNAQKFSNGKKVGFILKRLPGALVMEIRDEGIGIASEELSMIFQPFYRSTNAIEFPGSGIGLSLSFNILRLHNASIQVSSVIGEGSLFTITFPVI